MAWQRVAWLVPRALVHAGEAGFEGIDAGGLPVQGGEQLPVVGVQLLQDGQVVGMDLVLESNQLGVEVGAAHGLGLGGFGASSFFDEQSAAPTAPTTAAHPRSTRSAGRDWGVEICVHDA